MSGGGGGTDDGRNESRGAAGLLRLAIAVAIGAGVWLVALPRLARRPAIERHLRAMDDGEVNPAAMVYTELDRLPLRPAWAERHLVLWP